MSSTVLIQDLEEFTRYFMEDEGVTNYEISIEGNSAKGDNYCAEIIFYNVVSRDDGRLYNLVMKTAKRSVEFRKAMPIEFAYKTELYSYSKVFPLFRQFLSDSNSTLSLDYVPKLYWVFNEGNREIIIMENLKFQDYHLWNRMTPMNLDHIFSVMTVLGKHHGISLALRDKRHQSFKNIGENLNIKMLEFIRSLDSEKFYGAPLQQIIDLLHKNGRDDLVLKFSDFKNNIKNIFCETLEEDRLVICHGDCWNNNILFRYENEDHSKPTKTTLVDFQMSVIDTPVKDLSYYIFSACDRTSLSVIEKLLQKYYESLSDTMSALGSNCQDIFPYEKLKEHWLKYSKIGLISCIGILKIELFDRCEAPDMAAMCKAGQNLEENMQEMLGQKMRNEDEYNRRIIDVFTYYGENCLE